MGDICKNAKFPGMVVYRVILETEFAEYSLVIDALEVIGDVYSES